MLNGIHPILTGTILAHVDAMGHSDSVLVADAHFPAARLATRLVEVPALSAPAVIAALCTVLPLDDSPSVDLMESLDKKPLSIHDELIGAAGIGPEAARLIERFAFYDLAADAFLVIRTGETRPYGNALLRKGLATPLDHGHSTSR